MKTAPADVLLLQRASLSRYPPTLSQAILLTQVGLSVESIENDPPGGREATEADGRIVRTSAGVDAAFGEANPSPLARMKSRNRFFEEVSTKLAVGPKVAIAYDIDSVLALRGADCYRIAHFHELPLASDDLPYRSRQRIRNAIDAIREFDLVVHPDPMRAAIHAAVYGGVTPEVVYNCTRRVETVGESPRDWCGGRPFVLYQGVLAESRGVSVLLDAARLFGDDVGLVLRGVVPAGVGERLTARAAELGLSDRFEIRPQPGYSPDTVRETAGALAGFALYRTDGETNVRFSAYASNKLWELVSAGVPVIASDGPGYREIVLGHGLGFCVDDRSPEAVAAAVRSLAKDPGLRKGISERARRFHLERGNYEVQFAPVLDRVLRAAGRLR